MSPVVFCALDNFPSNKHGTIKNEPIVLDDIVREHSRKQLRPFILTSDDLRAPESRVVVLVCYEPASATDERCEPVIYYPNPQSLVITESEWSYSKESLQSDWHISRSCHYAAVECEGAAVVDHVAVEMRGKFKAKRASEPLSQSESFASVYRSPNHRQIWFTYMRAARSRIYSESTGISCLRDSFHTWRNY